MNKPLKALPVATRQPVVHRRELGYRRRWKHLRRDSGFTETRIHSPRPQTQKTEL
jgi:hypothetical protein